MSSWEDGVRLDGKAALVTGGSMGIGRAIAVLLADSGASVCIVARNPTRVADVVEAITAAGGNAVGVAGDVLDAAVRESSVRQCLDRFGSLDVLINNAGGSKPKASLVDVTDDDIRWTLDLNLEVPLRYSQLAWHSWMGENGGSIVNVSSLAGVRPSPGYGWYGVAKAGLNHLTRLLALELAPKVRVNCVVPGAIATETWRSSTTPEHQRLRAQRPLGRIGDPMNIAYTAVLLASPASEFTTGQEIAIDGGGSLV